MKGKKQKALVLLDLKENTQAVLDHTAKISKSLPIDIQLLYVKDPTEVVKTDCQLSACRSLNRQWFKIQNQMNELVKLVWGENSNNIKTKLIFGQVKNEIKQHIDKYEPDIIILGKRKPKMLSFLGDNINNLVQKTNKLVFTIKNKEQMVNLKQLPSGYKTIKANYNTKQQFAN